MLRTASRLRERVVPCEVRKRDRDFDRRRIWAAVESDRAAILVIPTARWLVDGVVGSGQQRADQNE